MTLFENPIFLTQRRLVHREGVLAAVLVAALIGLSLVSGLAACLGDPRLFGFSSIREAAKVFYTWTVGVEALVLVFGSFSRISRSLSEDRKAGLWEINRLTPLKPQELVLGYWLGSALREAYMAAVLAILGLVIVLIGGLPASLWLGTQLLLLGAALFFGLLAVLSGMAFQRSNAGVFLVAALAALQIFSLAQPRLVITNFLLPVYGTLQLFLGDEYQVHDPGGNRLPDLFGVPMDPILLTLGLQALLGLFLWRAAIRKTAEPFAPLLRRWDAMSLFGILTLVQQGLLWSLWRGHFGQPLFERSFEFNHDASWLSVAYCGTIVLGIVILTFSSPQPERVRVEALRTRAGNLRMVLSHSSVPLALALSAITAATLWPQFLFSMNADGLSYAVAVINGFDCFLIFSLWLEFCRLEFRRRALGFVALGLFILCVLPFVLGAVFDNADFGKLSLLSPGIVALGDPDGAETSRLLLIVLGHSVIAVLLAWVWRRKWAHLLVPTP